jgi:hypothetical protein
MPLGFPQVIGIIAGATAGAAAQLPLLVTPSGDGQTGVLQVGGLTATVGFPYGFTSDNQPGAATSAVGIMGWDGANADRVLVANVGASTSPGTPGSLVVQGSASGLPLPIAQPYAGSFDGQAAQANSFAGIAAWDGAGITRIRVANIGTSLGLNTPGALVVQGAASGTPMPVTGSLNTIFPYDFTLATQAGQSASAIGMMGWNANASVAERILTAPIGTTLGPNTRGSLVVQSAPNATPFPIQPIGQGALFAIPAGTANGTVIGAVPAAAQGVRMYVPPNCDFKYTVAQGQPGAPPTAIVEFFNPSTAQFPVVVDENLSAGQNVYVLSPTVANTALVARFI